MKKCVFLQSWRRRTRGLLILLSAVLALGACQPQKGADRLGPPWNSIKLRDNPTAFTELNAPPVVPLPPEDKTLSFEDCIATAAQQAPDLVDSAIQLEVAEISSDTAFWKRVPNVQAMFRVTANLTQNYEEYADTSYRFALGIYGFEPVVSYFSSKAAALMENIALLTYQIALEKRARQIGEALLRLETAKKMKGLNSQLLALAEKALRHHRAVEGSGIDQFGHARARHLQVRAQAEQEKADTSIASEVASLKVMMGIDLDRKLKVRADDLNALLQKDAVASAFADNSWEAVWNNDPEARIARTSHTLAEYGVQTAWARYLPTVTFDFYTANPYSDYATYSSRDEMFFTMQFSVPLFDWGERARGVEQRRLQKVQASQRVKLNRLKFAGTWNTAWQDQKLARAELEVLRHKAAAATLKEQKFALQYDARQVDFDIVLELGELRIEHEVNLQKAVLALQLEELSNWFLSGKFRRRFFAPDTSFPEADGSSADTPATPGREFKKAGNIPS